MGSFLIMSSVRNKDDACLTCLIFHDKRGIVIQQHTVRDWSKQKVST